MKEKDPTLTVYIIVAQNLNLLRLKLGLSKKEFIIEYFGFPELHYSHYVAILNAKKKLSLETAINLAQLCDIELYELFTPGFNIPIRRKRKRKQE